MASWEDIRATLQQHLDELLADPTTEQHAIDSCALALNIEDLITLATDTYVEEGRGFILLQPEGRAGLVDLSTLSMTYYTPDDFDANRGLPELTEHIRTYDPSCEVVVVIERDEQCRAGKFRVPDQLKRERPLTVQASEQTYAHKQEALRLQKQLLQLLRDPETDMREIDRPYLSLDPMPMLKLGIASYQQHGRGVLMVHLKGRKDLANPGKLPREYLPLQTLAQAPPDWLTASVRDQLESYNGEH